MGQFNYTFVCDVCGKEFYSKVDQSGWKTHKCNKCAGKPYKDYPVENGGYQPKPVPTTITTNKVQPVQVTKQEFNLSEYISDMLLVFVALRDECDKAGLTIPMENLCNWTTSIMIAKGRRTIE